MLIEFLGIPGVGKSSISRLVATKLQGRGYRVNEMTYDLDHYRKTIMRRLIKSFRIGSSIWNIPSASLAGFSAVAATQQATPSDFVKCTSNWVYIASLLSRQRKPTTINILDQGIAQAIWSVGLEAQRDDWLDLTLDGARPLLQRVDLVVHVSADIDVVKERLLSRSVRASRAEAYVHQIDAIQRAVRHCRAIEERLTATGMMVVKVENRIPEQLET